MKWFEIKNLADKAEIWIYEQIGEDFWTGGGMTAKAFQKELSGITAKQIDLHINSPGGEVFDGITIYNLLKQHPASITTYIDGLAASIASVIALAGDKVYMAENALYMIHNPYGMAVGDASEMRKMADTLDKVGSSLITAYASKTGRDSAEIADWMEQETWMGAQEALESGFVDEITDKLDMAASVTRFLPTMVKAKFQRIPEDLYNGRPMPTVRELEHLLRNNGCTDKQAKSILAGGYSKVQRDAESEAQSAQAVTEERRDGVQPKQPKLDKVLELQLWGNKLCPTQN
jgi:ATP-dependent Clp endopeptidase proteolytic subunit ClpP